MKVGDIVKLRNPKKKGEDKWRWQVEAIRIDCGDLPMSLVSCRRLDTKTHRLEKWSISILVPLSWWEKLKRRFGIIR